MKSGFYSYAILSGLILLSCSKDRIGSSRNDNTGSLTGNYLNDGGAPNDPKGAYAFGSIGGIILPVDAKAKVSIFSPKYFSTIFPAQDGSFKIDSLREGKYDLLIESNGGYKGVTIPGILVKKDIVVDLGTIQLEED